MGTKSTQPTKYLATYTEINNQVSEKTFAGLYCCVYSCVCTASPTGMTTPPPQVSVT